jgi:hypothetical protein
LKGTLSSGRIFFPDSEQCPSLFGNVLIAMPESLKENSAFFLEPYRG